MSDSLISSEGEEEILDDLISTEEEDEVIEDEDEEEEEEEDELTSSSEIGGDEEEDELDFDSPKRPRKSTTSSKAKFKGKSSNMRIVNHEQVHIPLGDKSVIEKLLSLRSTKEGQREIMVKYKNMSYTHCEWIPEHTVLAHKNGKQRLKRFLDKGVYDQWSGTYLFL